MDEITCGMTSLLFSKEILNEIKSNKELTLSDMTKGTPTTIQLYKDRVIWKDLGQNTKINIEKKVVCVFLFKKIK